MWTLVIMFVLDLHKSVSVDHVDGFTSAQTCHVAGQQLQRDVRYNADYGKLLYQCLKK